VNPDSSAHSAELSNTRKRTEGTPQLCYGFVELEGSGSSADGIFRSLGERCSKPSKADDVRVEFTPWRLAHSQYRYHGTPNTYDLGEL
jgi:hypothetical protein